MEQAHEGILRDLIQTGYATPRAMLYLLTGSQPIRFIIQKRRLMYLHHILHQDDKSTLKSFFLCQYETRKSKDWATMVNNDLIELNIQLNLVNTLESVPRQVFVTLYSIF